MILVAFSDVHGNIYALDKFIEKLKEISYDYLIFCGDIFGYYYNQKEVIERLQQLERLIWLRGNHDEYFLQLYRNYGKDELKYIKNYGHSYQNIRQKFSRKEINVIGEHDSQFVMRTDSGTFGFFHGTPEDSLEGRLYPEDVVLNSEPYHGFDIVIMGHTHYRMERRIGKTWVINPGSLGQPRDGLGYSFAVIDTKIRNLTFENIVFDERLLYLQIEKHDKQLTKLKDVLERKKN